MADSGAGSPRAAISNANSDGGIDTIVFAIGSGARTISLASPLPGIVHPVIIDGTSQPGRVVPPLIRVDGINAGPTAWGLCICAGPTRVRGLAITRFAYDGIELGDGDGHEIVGNYLGTDGTAALGSSSGVYVDNSVGAAEVGGNAAVDPNVISGNSTGILISGAAGTMIYNNYIGTNTAGTVACRTPTPASVTSATAPRLAVEG